MGKATLKDWPELGWQNMERSGKGHFVLDLITSYPMKEEDVMAAGAARGRPLMKKVTMLLKKKKLAFRKSRT